MHRESQSPTQSVGLREFCRDRGRRWLRNGEEVVEYVVVGYRFVRNGAVDCRFVGVEIVGLFRRGDLRVVVDVVHVRIFPPNFPTTVGFPRDLGIVDFVDMLPSYLSVVSVPCIDPPCFYLSTGTLSRRVRQQTHLPRTH